MLFKQLESVVLFVPDIDIAASWYADLFQTEIQRENAQYAFIQAPGCLLGFHPLDSKCPVGPVVQRSTGRSQICQQPSGSLN